VCAARLTKAAELSTDADVVVLSGWSRMPGTRSEAELMARAWHGRAAELVVDPDARTTAENATNALDDIRRVGTTEVVVVTSSWHAARAATAFRWLLRGSGTNVNVASPPGRSWRASLRELALWPLLPGQLFRARCSRRRGESRFPTA
jgi:uncharacterized SAM-binding protein YcdF (DUF218 family)